MKAYKFIVFEILRDFVLAYNYYVCAIPTYRVYWLHANVEIQKCNGMCFGFEKV